MDTVAISKLRGRWEWQSFFVAKMVTVAILPILRPGIPFSYFAASSRHCRAFITSTLLTGLYFPPVCLVAHISPVLYTVLYQPHNDTLHVGASTFAHLSTISLDFEWIFFVRSQVEEQGLLIFLLLLIQRCSGSSEAQNKSPENITKIWKRPQFCLRRTRAELADRCARGLGYFQSSW